MQFFEILCILLGVVNGALMPLLPDTRDPRRPIGVISLLSLTLALLILFLPVIVSSPRFVATSMLTVVGAGIAFGAVRSARAVPQAKLSVQNVQPKSVKAEA